MIEDLARELAVLQRRVANLERGEQWPNLLLGSPIDYTIASGAITLSSVYEHYIRVDTQGGGATDDLDTISGGAAGQLLVVRSTSNARTVVVKDGTGNIACAGDLSMDTAQDTILLIYRGDVWLEISRSNNA